MTVDTQEKAVELAKRHIGGTFDNAHAAVWLKHFKKEDGESEEHRIDRFNKWLNNQATEMYKDCFQERGKAFGVAENGSQFRNTSNDQEHDKMH